jgi:hypothetical protein
MTERDVVETETLHGSLDGTPYQRSIMKDAAYNVKLIATFGSLVERPDAKVQKRRVANVTKIFRYTEPFHNHYKYRHAVDDQKNHRHLDISIERNMGHTLLSYSP